jgi:cellulose biosynthesis protein BcsQ
MGILGEIVLLGKGLSVKIIAIVNQKGGAGKQRQSVRRRMVDAKGIDFISASAAGKLMSANGRALLETLLDDESVTASYPATSGIDLIPACPVAGFERVSVSPNEMFLRQAVERFRDDAWDTCSLIVRQASVSE